MELINNKTYTSNNPCFPGQLFHVTGFERAERFGEENVLITYERWAFTLGSDFPYKIETTKSWWMDSKAQSFLGLQLPGDMQAEFNRMREAVLTVNSMISR